jgi:hypothetical protein
MAMTNTERENNYVQYGHYTQDEFIEDGYGPQKLKRGRWRICIHEDDDFHDLWHQCDKDNWDMFDSEYMTSVPCDVSYTGIRKIKPNWHCQDCFAVPPASIVTVWCLLEPDYTSEHVQEAVSYQIDMDKGEGYPAQGPLGMGDWHVSALSTMSMYKLLK